MIERQPEFSFKLTGVSRMYTDRKFEAEAHVEGTFVGRVKGHLTDYETGRVVNIIEVLEADLDN